MTKESFDIHQHITDSHLVPRLAVHDHADTVIDHIVDHGMTRSVYFLDPDGMKLEGMRYGERHEEAASKCTAARRKRQPRGKAA